MTSIFDDIKNAFNRRGNTLNQLILINVIVFVFLTVFETLARWFKFDGAYFLIINNLSLPAKITAFLYKPWTLFSYFFTHADFLHILFNMLNLYWFGQLVKEYLGDKRLVSLYVLGGIAGGLLYLLFYNIVPLFENRIDASVMIGASASVLAIIVAAATLLPDFTFNLILIGPVRIKYIAAFLIVLSISGAAGGNAGGNIAHLGGAILGFVFIRLLQSGTDLGKPIHAMHSYFSNLVTGRPNLKVSGIL